MRLFVRAFAILCELYSLFVVYCAIENYPQPNFDLARWQIIGGFLLVAFFAAFVNGALRPRGYLDSFFQKATQSYAMLLCFIGSAALMAHLYFFVYPTAAGIAHPFNLVARLGS